MQKVNVNEYVDGQKFNRFHGMLLLWTIFIIVVDGYDMFMLGAIMPALMDDWNMSSVVGGSIGSYSLFGMMIGALVMGPLADRYGRKNIILLSTILFTIFTFISAFAPGPEVFGVQRFIAGIGLGGVMPNLIALVTEYAPRKMKSTMVAIMFSGHAAGGIVASLGALAMLPRFGWQGVVLLSGIPLLVLPILYKKMPESFSYYIKRNKKEKLVETLNKINPDVQFTGKEEFVLNVAEKTDSSLGNLFKEKRGFSTVMFWLAAFSALLVMYGLSTWLPTIMREAGFPIGSSLSFLIVLNLGGVTGAIFGGKLADTFGSRKVLITFFLVGFLALTALSFSPNQMLLYLLLFIAGATTTGSQINTNAYVSQYYPVGIRSTAVGWELGIGRIGGILGPAIGGFLLSSKLPIFFNFLAWAIPCIIAAIAIFLVQEKYGLSRRQAEAVKIEQKTVNA